jgi:hypothetical protein
MYKFLSLQLNFFLIVNKTLTILVFFLIFFCIQKKIIHHARLRRNKTSI